MAIRYVLSRFLSAKSFVDEMGRIDDRRWDAAGGFEFEQIRRNRVNRHGALRAEVRAPKLVHWYLRGPPGNVVVVQSCLGLIFPLVFSANIRF